MLKNRKDNFFVSTDGFTLIEVMIAIVVLTIGILGVLSMQTTSIGGNAGANHISTAAVWGSKEIEEIFSINYDDASLNDGGTIGVAGLNVTNAPNADGSATMESPDGMYNIYWNVVEDYPIPNVKNIRVIVTRADMGIRRTVTLNYVKAKYE